MAAVKLGELTNPVPDFDADVRKVAELAVKEAAAREKYALVTGPPGTPEATAAYGGLLAASRALEHQIREVVGMLQGLKELVEDPED